MTIADLKNRTPVRTILGRLVLAKHKDNQDFANGFNELNDVSNNFDDDVRTDDTIRRYAPTWANRFLKELCFC